jgi:hypothetical protein
MRTPKNQAAEMVAQLTSDTALLQNDLDLYAASRQEIIQKNMDTIAVLESMAEWDEVPDEQAL